MALATVYAGAARTLAAAGEQPALPTPAEAAAADRTPMIMVVDDSLTVRRVTQRLLVREGYRVQLAKDGLEALERIAQERPTVVLSDIEMPRMDGFELSMRIRENARTAAVPIVIISSRTAEKHRSRAQQIGVNAFLGKPYQETEMLAQLARYVPHQQDAAVAA